jgi:hypothetical protein
VSNAIQGLVWNAAIPHPHAKAVAVKLADWADDDGGSIYPSAATVARMCVLARSSVCKWQFALEQCGLLRVVQRSAGGARSDTTERAFDVALLQRIAWRKVEGRWVPPQMQLVERTIERSTVERKTGKVKTVSVTVFKVARYCAGDGSDGPEEPVAPVRATDGSRGGTRPHDGRVPVGGTDTTRPCHGHDPSSIRQSDPSGAGPYASLLPQGAADLIIPFEGTDPVGDGGWGAGASLIEAAREAAAEAAAKLRLGTDKSHLPFAPSALHEVRRLCIDLDALVARYLQKTRGRRIKDPSRYLVRMAREEVAKREGVSVAMVARLTDRDREVRTAAMAEAVGALPDTGLEALARKAASVRTPNGAALLAALRR